MAAAVLCWGVMDLEDVGSVGLAEGQACHAAVAGPGGGTCCPDAGDLQAEGEGGKQPIDVALLGYWSAWVICAPPWC